MQTATIINKGDLINRITEELVKLLQSKETFPEVRIDPTPLRNIVKKEVENHEVH